MFGFLYEPLNQWFLKFVRGLLLIIIIIIVRGV